MKPHHCAVCLLAFAAILPAAAQDTFSGRIESLDPAFDRLIAPDAKIEVLASGFEWAEGPVWFEGALLFSDVPKNIVHRWKPGTIGAEVYLEPSGQLTPAPGFAEPGSNGLARDAQGRLLLCQHGERRIARHEGGGRFTSLADRFEGKRFNSPNDLALRANGDLYFTDPPYGLKDRNQSPLKELPFNGVFRVTPAGQVTLLTDQITFPNGIAFSPDEKILYVGVSSGPSTHLAAFDVQPDGTLANHRVFLKAHLLLNQTDSSGNCDGLKVDRDGNVWASGPGGVLVVAPDGRLLGRIRTNAHTANVGWGDADGGTLYLTSDMFLVRVRTLTKGAGW